MFFLSIDSKLWLAWTKELIEEQLQKMKLLKVPIKILKKCPSFKKQDNFPLEIIQTDEGITFPFILKNQNLEINELKEDNYK